MSEQTGGEGGTAVIFREYFKVKQQEELNCKGCEIVSVQFQGVDNVFYDLFIIYICPKFRGTALEQFWDWVTNRLCNASPVIIPGDLNHWLDAKGNRDVKHFFQTSEGVGLTSLVTGPTHQGGHSPDGVFSKEVEIVLEATEELP